MTLKRWISADLKLLTGMPNPELVEGWACPRLTPDETPGAGGVGLSASSPRRLPPALSRGSAVCGLSASIPHANEEPTRAGN